MLNEIDNVLKIMKKSYFVVQEIDNFHSNNVFGITILISVPEIQTLRQFFKFACWRWKNDIFVRLHSLK